MLLLLLALQAPEPATTVGVANQDAFRFEAPLDGAGEVSLLHLKLSVDVKHRASDRDLLWVIVGVDRLDYDFSPDAELLPGVSAGLFEQVNVLRADVAWMHFFDESWTGVAFLSLYDSFESGASMSDAFSIGAGVGAVYRVDETLSLGLVLRGVTRLEERPYVFPVPQIDWKFAPGWQFRTDQRTGFTALVSRELDEAKAWFLEARMHYLYRRFRLDEDSLPSEGVVQDDRGCLDLGVRYAPSPSFAVGLYAGADVWQEFEIDARNGDTQAKVETDPAPYLWLTINLTF
jgi:hypothetical protein